VSLNTELKLERVVKQSPNKWLFVYEKEQYTVGDRHVVKDRFVSFFAEELMDQRLFEKRCLEELGFWPCAEDLYPVTQGWRSYINQCLEMVEET
jgi:hypothetical protein